jgi:hypothetical protein
MLFLTGALEVIPPPFWHWKTGYSRLAEGN